MSGEGVGEDEEEDDDGGGMGPKRGGGGKAGKVGKEEDKASVPRDGGAQAGTAGDGQSVGFNGFPGWGAVPSGDNPFLSTLPSHLTAAGLSTIPFSKDLAPELEEKRSRATMAVDRIFNAGGISSSGAFEYMGVDNSLHMDLFKELLKVEVREVKVENGRAMEMHFDLIGVDAALANAYRRIMLAEVPTLAIEKVLVRNNTSVMQDEVLAHRLGLIPIDADPRRFGVVKRKGRFTEKNSCVFRLRVECTGEEQATATGKSKRMSVLSKELEWLPLGSEFEDTRATAARAQRAASLAEGGEDGDGGGEDGMEVDGEAPGPVMFTCFQRDQSEFITEGIKPVYDDILIVRMRPGQAIDAECIAVKGTGRTHAKWSPVATVTYRMRPQITLRETFKGDEAEALAQSCPNGCIEVVRGAAVLKNTEGCHMCLENLRTLSSEEAWKGRLAVHRLRSHFLFGVESTGALSPKDIFIEATHVLGKKCTAVLDALDEAVAKRRP